MTKIFTMKGFKSNIEKDTRGNTDFRRAIYTGKHLQLVLMSLKAGDELGAEIHPGNDQFFRFESGSGKCLIDGHEYLVTDGDAVVIPAGALHNVINTGAIEDLKMYTIYAPPHHRVGIVRTTKENAMKNEAVFDGKTTEKG